VRKRKEYFRIRSFARHYDRESGKFTVNIAYETAAPEPSERVVAVAESFGLGLDKWEKFVICDNVELSLSPTDIVYITGDSGSGKSVLLRALLKDLGDEAIDMNAAPKEPTKPLIETIGKTVEEGLELLSRVGLNDAPATPRILQIKPQREPKFPFFLSFFRHSNYSSVDTRCQM